MKPPQSRKNATDPVRRGQRISTIGTALLILLMLAYLIITLVSSANLAAQTEIISNHPFEVVISTGEVKNHISEMSLRTERLQRHRSAEDIHLARTELEELYAGLEGPLAAISGLYLGSADDVRALNEAITLLQAAHKDYFDFAGRPGITDQELEEYARQNLQPLYELAVERAQQIASVAQEKRWAMAEPQKPFGAPAWWPRSF